MLAECLLNLAAAAATARVARPSAEVKRAAWEYWHSPAAAELSTYQIQAEMSGFAFAHQSALVEPFVAPFFAEIKQLYQERSKGFHEAFFDLLFPFQPESSAIQALASELLVSLDAQQDAMLMRALKDQIDAMQRAQQCRALIGF